jgi:hypothetical protein
LAGGSSWRRSSHVAVAGHAWNIERFCAKAMRTMNRLSRKHESNASSSYLSRASMGGKPTSPTYAPAAFVDDGEAKRRGLRKADFKAAMSRLFTTNKIYVEQYGRPSRPYFKTRDQALKCYRCSSISFREELVVRDPRQPSSRRCAISSPREQLWWRARLLTTCWPLHLDRLCRRCRLCQCPRLCRGGVTRAQRHLKVPCSTKYRR